MNFKSAEGMIRLSLQWVNQMDRIKTGWARKKEDINYTEFL